MTYILSIISLFKSVVNHTSMELLHWIITTNYTFTTQIKNSLLKVYWKGEEYIICVKTVINIDKGDYRMVEDLNQI